MVGKGHAEERRYGVWMFFWTTVVLDERGTGRSQIGCWILVSFPERKCSSYPSFSCSTAMRSSNVEAKAHFLFTSYQNSTQPKLYLLHLTHDAALGHHEKPPRQPLGAYPPSSSQHPIPFVYIHQSTRHLKPKALLSLSLSLSNSIIPLVKHTHTVPQMHMYILPPPSQRQNGFFGLAGEISSICRKRLVWNKNSWSKIQRASG